MNSARSIARSGWVWDVVLGGLSIVWAVVFVRLYAPGRVNVDIANQYAQATGAIPFSDWHPPVMAVVWRGLIDLTGEQASLFVLQTGLIAASCWVLGVIIHRCGAPRWVSLLGPAVMVTPWTLSQMSMLWKDTQMAAALLAAVMLLTVARLVPKTWLLWVPALGLLIYAVGLRKNAVFAIIPIAVYLGWCLVTALAARRSRRHETPGSEAPPSRRTRVRSVLATASAGVVVLIILVGGVKASDATIAARYDVQPTGQISQVLLDDVMFSVPDKELMASDAPPELKAKIGQARPKCLQMGEIWDAYWNCYGKGATGENFSPIADQDALRQLWLDTVITHPLRYAEYRATVFSYYFFSSSLEYWPAEWHGEGTKVGIAQGDEKADYLFRPYVEDFALATFPMVFKPWFWCLLAVLLLVAVRRLRRTDRSEMSRSAGPRPAPSVVPEIVMLATSALCYVAGYFPIVPANHFRYTFWPALAVTVGLVLTLGMWSARRRIARVRSASPEADDLE